MRRITGVARPQRRSASSRDHTPAAGINPLNRRKLARLALGRRDCTHGGHDRSETCTAFCLDFFESVPVRLHSLQPAHRLNVTDLVVASHLGASRSCSRKAGIFLAGHHSSSAFSPCRGSSSVVRSSGSPSMGSGWALHANVIAAAACSLHGKDAGHFAMAKLADLSPAASAGSLAAISPNTVQLEAVKD
jgi:hypothetical protein